MIANSLVSGAASFCILGTSQSLLDSFQFWQASSFMRANVNYRLKRPQDIFEFLTGVASPNYLVLSKMFSVCVCVTI